MELDERVALRWYGAVRVAIGLVLLADPGRSLRGLVGPAIDQAPVRVLGRIAGGRDVVVGVATLAAANDESDEAVRRWATYGAACDAIDLVAFLGAWRSLPKRTRAVSVGAALSGVVTGGWIASGPR